MSHHQRSSCDAHARHTRRHAWWSISSSVHVDGGRGRRRTQVNNVLIAPFMCFRASAVYCFANCASGSVAPRDHAHAAGAICLSVRAALLNVCNGRGQFLEQQLTWHARMHRRSAWTVADGISPNRSAGAGASQTCSAAACCVWFPDGLADLKQIWCCREGLGKRLVGLLHLRPALLSLGTRPGHGPFCWFQAR